MPARKLLISLFIVLFAMLTSPLRGQDQYIQSAGFRGGPLIGVSYKRFITVPGTVEGILGFNFTNDRVYSLTGLYQHNFFINYQINWFAGGGITLAFNSSSFQFNGEAMIGLEYVVPNFPVNFSIDYKPSFHVVTGEFIFNEFGLSGRYIF